MGKKNDLCDGRKSSDKCEKKKVKKDVLKQDAKDLFGFSDTNCDCCGVSNTEIGGFLLQCATCRRAYYCSMACFNKHLPKHMEFCETSALEHEPEGRKNVKKEETPKQKEVIEKLTEAEAKRNFIDTSCSESETETESTTRKNNSVKQRRRKAGNLLGKEGQGNFIDAPRSESETKKEPIAIKRERKRSPVKQQKHARNVLGKEVKRYFIDASCSESETETDSIARKRRSSPVKQQKGKADKTTKNNGIDESCPKSEVAVEQEKSNQAEMIIKDDASLSESQAKSGPIARHNNKRGIVSKQENLEAGKTTDEIVPKNSIDECCPESETKPALVLRKQKEKKTVVRRVFNDGMCSDSETETESLAGRRRSTQKTSSLVRVSVDAELEPATEEVSTFVPAQHLPNGNSLVNTAKLTSNNGSKSESEPEAKFEVDADGAASASLSILYAVFKNAPHQLHLDGRISDCNSDSEFHSEEWETDSGFCTSESGEWETASDFCCSDSSSSNGAFSKETGSLDMVMEVNENLDGEEELISENGERLRTDVPTKAPDEKTTQCSTSGIVLCSAYLEDCCDRAVVRPVRSFDDISTGSYGEVEGSYSKSAVADGKRPYRKSERCAKSRRRVWKSDSASDLTSDSGGSGNDRRKARIGKVLCRRRPNGRADRAAKAPSRSTSNGSREQGGEGRDRDGSGTNRRNFRPGKVLCRRRPNGKADSAAKAPSRSTSNDLREQGGKGRDRYGSGTKRRKTRTGTVLCLRRPSGKVDSAAKAPSRSTSNDLREPGGENRDRVRSGTNRRKARTGKVLCRRRPSGKADSAARAPSRSTSNDSLEHGDESHDRRCTNWRKTRTGKVLCRRRPNGKADSAARAPSRSTSDDFGKNLNDDGEECFEILERDGCGTNRLKAASGKVLCRLRPNGKADGAAKKPSRTVSDTTRENSDESQESDSWSSISDDESFDKPSDVQRKFGLSRSNGIQLRRNGTKNSDDDGKSVGSSRCESGDSDGRVRGENKHGALYEDNNGKDEVTGMRNGITAFIAGTDVLTTRKAQLGSSNEFENSLIRFRTASAAEESERGRDEGQAEEGHAATTATEFTEWSSEASDVEETRIRRGGGVIKRLSKPAAESEISVRIHGTPLKPEWTESQLRAIIGCEIVGSAIESVKPDWIESLLRTTAVGEVIKTLGTVSPSKLKEKVEPEWLRQTPLRTTSKGSKLRRQLSLRSDRNLARRITNESIDQNSEFIRKVRLRPTTRGKMLKRGHSIRGTERRSTPSGSSLSRSGSNNSTLESNSGQSETRERREATQKDGIMRLKKQRSVNAKHGSGLSRSDDNGSFSRVKEARASTKTKGERLQNDSRVRVTRQGSFDVTQGDRTMTLNIVHVNEEQPKSTRPVVLRATSKGARLMRGESLGKGQHKLVSPSSAAQTTDPICVPNDHLPDLIG